MKTMTTMTLLSMFGQAGAHAAGSGALVPTNTAFQLYFIPARDKKD